MQRKHTFILSYVLECKCEAGVLALDNAHLAKGALADDAQQAEVVEVDLGGEDEGRAVALALGGGVGEGVGAGPGEGATGLETRHGRAVVVVV